MSIFLGWLPDWTLRVSVLLVLASVVCMVLQKRPPALRHVIWAAAFGVALFTPLLTPIGFRIARPAVVGPVMRVAEAPASEQPAGGEPAPSQPPRPSRFPWIPGLWAIGALGLAARTMNGVRKALRLRRNAPPLDRATIAQRACLPPELFTGVALAESDAAVVPMTLGLSAPLILLPADQRGWSAVRLRAVLLHELAHVRRRDSLVQWLPQTVCVLHWFNPLVWLAKSLMSCESERACDDAVVRTGASGRDFARDLVEIAQSIQGKGAYPMALALTTKLERRIRRLLDASADRRPLTARCAILAGCAVVLLLAPLAGVHAQVAQAPSPTPSRPSAPARPPVVAQVRQAVPRQPAEPGNVNQGTGTLSGMVSDPSGAVVVGAEVRATSDGADVQTTTSATGGWSLPNLPAGRYSVVVLVPGFALNRFSQDLSPGQTVSKNVRLQVGRIRESVTITATGTPRSALAAASGTPQRIRVGGNVQAARLLQKTNPVYPESARQQGIEGTVGLQAVIDRFGNVLSTQVTNSDAPPELVDAALAAVRTWQYQPTLLNGEPVEVITEITLNFELR